jgi:hypothetical protein
MPNTVKLSAASLRNLTTGKLHTEMGEVYAALEAITREKGVMTHMLPRAIDALLPFLKKG